jgi:flagellin FlaB
MHLPIHLQIKYISNPVINAVSTLKVVESTTNRRDVNKMGKKLRKLLKKEDFGDMGIGAMIIFIAMVLVAGIAASVLVQTSTSLQMQTLKTGSQTTESIASGILMQSIEGYYDSTAGAITRLALEIRPRAGSPDIDLQTTVIEVSDSNVKYVLRYGGTVTLLNETDGNNFNSSYYPIGTATTEFYVIVLQDADGSCTEEYPVGNLGDHMILAIGDLFGGLQPRKIVVGQVVPEEGSPAIIDFRTPESFTDPVMELQ